MSHAYLPNAAATRPRLSAFCAISTSLAPATSFPSALTSSSRSVASIR